MKNNNRTAFRLTMSNETFDALAKDAARCRRTVPKHVEAILCAYAKTEDVALRKTESADILDTEVIQ